MRNQHIPALLLLLLAMAAPLRAQLRPLDPLDWRPLEPGAGVGARVGGGVFLGQRASIGGVRGRVVEVPAALLSWTTGRAALRAVIHPVRLMREQDSVAPAVPGTTLLSPGGESDAGDNALETAIRLTGRADPPVADGPSPPTRAMAAVRWGVRFSTHNDKKGLDRHKTDFYALAGARLLQAGWMLGGEAGVGVYGTRDPDYDKALPFLYSLSALRRFGPVEPSLALTGQASRTRIRGNENLSELRAALRVGRTRFVEATLVRGLVRYSPRAGFLLFAGLTP